MARVLLISCSSTGPNEGLRAALRDDISASVALSSDPADAATKMSEQSYDLVLVDEAAESPASITARLREQDCNIPIIVLGNSPERGATEALKAGADLWLRRTDPPDYIAAGISRVLQSCGRRADYQQVFNDLQASERRFAEFMRHLPGAIWIKDLDGRYIYANEIAELLWQQPRESIYGKRDSDVFAPEIAKQYQETDKLAIADKSVQLVERVPFSNAVHSFLLHKFLISQGPGQPPLLGGIALDITARVRAEEALAESNQRLYQAMKSARMISWEWDLATNRVACSDGMIPQAPYSGPAKLFCERVHPDDRERVHTVVQKALERDANYSLEYRTVLPNGEVRWISDQATIQRDVRGQPTRVTGIAIEITERKRAEEALRESESRFRKLASTLEESARQKDDFLAMLAHELRNPLAPLRNGLRVLQMPQASPDHQAKAKGMMSRQLAHLSGLIDDLLDVSRISRGKILLHLEHLNLVTLVRDSVEDQRAGLEAKGLRVSFEADNEDLWVDGDRTRLAQIAGNLLSNAAKFTDSGGSVAIRIQFERDGFASVTVRDTGIGIAPEFLGHLFEPFHQADHSLARSHGGLGLGLAVVKGLVQLHGGTVRAESAGPGTGASFTFRIPAQKLSELEFRSRHEENKGPSFRILIIEDNPDTEESLKMILQLDGHQVLSAHTGAQGIDLAEREQPDVVLCDIGLPDIDGYSIARRLRATTHSTLIAVSGYGQAEDKKRALDAGFHKHLTKPLDPEILNKVLASLSPQPAMH